MNNAYAEYRASFYIDSYTTFLYSPGNGSVEVWFDVKGNVVSDEVGALTIVLKESSDQNRWTTVKTYNYTDYSNMMAYNTMQHISHVDYNGTSGKYYKASLLIWVGNNGGGDSRTIYAPAISAA